MIEINLIKPKWYIGWIKRPFACLLWQHSILHRLGLALFRDRKRWGITGK